MAFTGAMLALGLMTIISVGIGVACSNIPQPLQESLPLGEWVAAAMLGTFGVSTILVSSCCETGTSSGCLHTGKQRARDRRRWKSTIVLALYMLQQLPYCVGHLVPRLRLL